MDYLVTIGNYILTASDGALFYTGECDAPTGGDCEFEETGIKESTLNRWNYPSPVNQPSVYFAVTSDSKGCVISKTNNILTVYGVCDDYE